MKNRHLIAQAKQKWVNTMKQLYPNFNPKLWGRHQSYRDAHPQAKLND